MADHYYKHCEEKYLPKKGNTLRVGTLSSFRTAEKEAVKDVREGRFAITLLFDGEIEVETAWVSDVTLDSYYFLGAGFAANNLSVSQYSGKFTRGSVLCTDNNMRTLGASEGKLRLSGSIDVNFDGADAFVFCISKNSEIGSVIDDFSYGSRWQISEANIKKFMDVMSNEIQRHILSGAGGITAETVGPLNMPGFRSPNPNDQPGLQLKIRGLFLKVQYLEKAIKITRESDLSRSEVEQMFDTSPFTKPKSFEPENEFRFIFQPMLVDGEKHFLIPNILNPIFINCDPFLQFVEQE